MPVSIVIPTYDRPEKLDELLSSIIAQTYKEFEVIIINDNSKQKKEYDAIIEKYKKGCDLTYYFNNRNKGAPYCRNKGIIESKYDLIALTDDDDLWSPNKLLKQVDLFNRSQEKVGLIYTWANVVDEKGEILYKFDSNISGKSYRNILKECFIPSSSVMVRKQCIIDAGLFDESLPSCQDWDMWTRMFKYGYQSDVIKEELVTIRKHKDDRIGTSSNAKKGYLIFYRKHFFGMIKTIQIKQLKNYLILKIKDKYDKK